MSVNAIDGAPLDTVSMVVTFRRPVFENAGKIGRAERFRLLHSRSVEVRESIIRWIADQGLSGDMSRISDPMMFNMLFIICTPRLAERLTNAPNVLKAFANDDLPVELL